MGLVRAATLARAAGESSMPCGATRTRAATALAVRRQRRGGGARRDDDAVGGRQRRFLAGQAAGVLAGAAEGVHLALHDVHRLHRRHAERLAQAGGERPQHAVVDVQQVGPHGAGELARRAEVVEMGDAQNGSTPFSVPGSHGPARPARVGRQASNDSADTVRPWRALARTSPPTAVDRPPT